MGPRICPLRSPDDGTGALEPRSEDRQPGYDVSRVQTVRDVT
jgi:hypothetical protein